MSEPLFSVTRGWTKVLTPFTIKIDGVLLDLTGLTITPSLRPLGGALMTANLGTVVPAANQTLNKGELAWTPDAATFADPAKTFLLHWRVVDGASKIVFVPNGAPELIYVSDP